MRHILLSLSVFALGVTACTGGDHSHAGEGIEISNARINPPLPGQTTGVAFLRLDNHGADDRLLAVSSSVSGRIELHTHRNEDGVMKMRRVDGIALPHGKAVELKPGSFHIMLFNADMELGDEAVLTLDFEKADDLTVVATVEQRGSKPKGDKEHGSHSGQ